jgi:acetyltransferase-like isoleucine patch superfamily enzyme
MNSTFYSEVELQQIGLKSVGKNVFISRKSSIYSPENINIGNNVRIDDFCLLSGNITIGSNIHISAYCALYGAKGIILEDYTGLSPRCTLFSAMDDFGGNYLIGPIHNPSITHVTGGNIIIKRFVQVGAGCMIFPNITIGEGSVIGSMSLINKSVTSWGVYIGVPIYKLKNRKKGLLKFISKNE